MQAMVYRDSHSVTCLRVHENDLEVQFITCEEGIIDVHTLARDDFEQRFTKPLPNQNVQRAAALYRTPITPAIVVTNKAVAILDRIIHSTPTPAASAEHTPTKENTMSNANASVASTEGAAKNVTATNKASLKTGTKARDLIDPKAAGKAAKGKAAAKAPAAEKPAKGGKAAPAAPAKGAGKLAKPAGKAAAQAAPAKGAKGKAAAAPAARGGGFASKADQKIKLAPDAKARSGAMADLVEFVRSAKGGVTRADAIAHMVKKDKTDGNEQRARNNISWGLRNNVFVEA